jgi:aminopeptidase N
MWDEHKFGHDDFLYSDVKSNQEQYYAAWARGQRRPIVTKNYTNPDAVFDTYAYPRGGAVLHMLRTYLGEDNWWRSINHYLTKYANQPVETAQFRIAIEETTGQPMDWFFDEWLYRMGHPVFRVTQDYDAANKVLTLKVRQEQRPDPESQYPQVTFFQTPVDVEIMTAATRRVDRVQIEAKEEQVLKFTVDSEPLLVNFDNEGTLIKELLFVKTTGQLIYQLQNDRDPLGRIWASSQLSSRMRDEKIAATDRNAILKALSQAATKDPFWGARVEVLVALNGVKEAKDALLAATKDTDARVRARAVGALAAAKDPGLVDTYVQLLNDRSYAVIRASASALGKRRVPPDTTPCSVDRPALLAGHNSRLVSTDSPPWVINGGWS